MIDNQLFINSFSSLFMVVWVALNPATEGRTANAFHAFGNCNSSQGSTIIECPRIYVCHTIAKTDRCKAATIAKGSHANVFYTVGDDDGGQAVTLFERICADCLHTITDADCCHTFAIGERRTSDARHAVGNCYGR